MCVVDSRSVAMGVGYGEWEGSSKGQKASEKFNVQVMR